MPSATDRFLQAAATLGVEVAVRTYPDGTRTAEQAAAAVGCEVDQIVKSLVFMADDDDGSRPVLALTSGANRVDTASLAAAVSAHHVRKATADEVRSATGYAIGGTPPFGHPAPIPTVVDPHLLKFPEVWAAAGTPRDVFPLSPQDLVRATGGRVTDVTE